MMKWKLLFACCLCHTLLYAQTKKKFKINPGERVLYAIPKEDLYSFAEFTEGTVYMRNDNFSKARMNYNALFEEMQFIDPKGDTLSLANEATFREIVAGKDTFYYDGGYIRLQKNLGTIKIGYRDLFTFANRQRLGGMGETTSASVDTYTSMSSNQSFKELVAKEIITLVKERIYFIGDRFNHFKQANRKTVLDLFPGKEKEVKAWLKENQPDFNNEEYLLALINHFSVTE